MAAKTLKVSSDAGPDGAGQPGDLTLDVSVRFDRPGQWDLYVGATAEWVDRFPNPDLLKLKAFTTYAQWPKPNVG